MNKLRIAAWITAVTTLWGAAAAGQTNSKTVYSFLRSDVGARAAAMGGSFMTMAGDAANVFYNAAGLATLGTGRGEAGFFKHLMDINSGYVAYAQPLEEIGHVGAGVLYTNYGSFTETDEAGNQLGSFSAGDLAVSVAYANTLAENLAYGAALKFIYSSIAGYSSSAIAADAGILYLLPESRVALGASLRNIGAQIDSYDETREPLPLDLSVGGSVVPKGLPLLLELSFHRLTDPADSFGNRFAAFSLGGEFTISRYVLLRIGYDNTRRKDLKVGDSAGLAGFSAGFGVRYQQFNLDYALSSLGSVGALHRISLGSAF
jgi:hypothetical protein